MKRIQPSALVLIACAFASRAQPAQAVLDPQVVIHDIEVRTRAVHETADSLSVSDHDPRVSLTFRNIKLADISDQMNAIDRDLRFLDAHKASLAPWEVEAIGQSAPWMVQTAIDTDAAIEALKNESTHLAFAPNYNADVEKIVADSTKAQRVLHDYLKLQSARKQEHRAVNDLGL